jgi:hypothetical protein
MKNSLRFVTREGHLDHMVRVTPLIFLGYGLQSYFLMNMNTEGQLTKHILVLGLALASMIGLFLLHDVYHQVHFFESHFESGWRFFGKKKTINYSEIESIDVSETEQKFASLIIRLQNNRKIVFYFVDKPEELKSWIEKHKDSHSSFSQAA